MTDYEKTMQVEEDKLKELSRLLVTRGMSDLAYNRATWICTEGHYLIHHRRLRKGGFCPITTGGVRCTGRVGHEHLSYWQIEDALWEVARRYRWTVTLVSYAGGTQYQWEVSTGHKGRGANKSMAALEALMKALAYADHE